MSLFTAASSLSNRTTRLPTGHVLTRETADFITAALWPANSPDLNPVDLGDLVEAAGACVPQPDS